MAIREGLWDCPSCGAKGVPGRLRDCPSCNTPRADDVLFYLPKDAREITSFVQISDATAGADWYCQHCDSGNPASAVSCQHCGASRENNPEHQTRTYTPETIPHNAKEAELKPEAAAPPKRKFGKGKIIAGGLTLSAGIGTYLAVTASHIPVTVSGFAWERSITVETNKTFREKDWEVPTGGRLVSQAKAIHHYEKVVDHYENKVRQVCQTVVAGYRTENRQVCENVQTGTSSYNCGSQDLGNGYFQDKTCTRPEYSRVCHNESYDVPQYTQSCHNEPWQEPIYREEPRYATQYTYDIDRWVTASTPTLAQSNHTPQWPKLKLGTKEREGARTAEYTVTLKDKDGKTYRYAPNLQLWQSLKAGQKLTATVDFDDKVLEIEPQK